METINTLVNILSSFPFLLLWTALLLTGIGIALEERQKRNNNTKQKGR